jgi:S1-C subfamily serine protease
MKLVVCALAAIVVGCSPICSSLQTRYLPLKEKPIVAQTISRSVYVIAGTEMGTGVVVKRDGITYVWTCAHVLNELVSKHPIVSYKKATVQKDAGGKVLETSAKIIGYDERMDLAVLQLDPSPLSDAVEGATFYNGTVPVGEDVFHVGHYKATFKYSFSKGIIAYNARVWNHRIKGVLENGMEVNELVDQTTVTAYPGSSGGGIFISDARCVGLLAATLTDGDSANMLVPSREMIAWAGRMNIPQALPR